MRGTTLLSEGKNLIENESKVYKGPVRGQMDSDVRIWLSLKAGEVPGSISVYPQPDVSECWTIDHLQSES